MALSFIEFQPGASTSGGTQHTGTFANPSQAGDFFVVIGYYDIGGSLTSIKTDKNDNAVLQKLNGSTTPLADGWGQSVYVAIINPTVGSTVITTTTTGSFSSIAAWLVRGAATPVQDQGVWTNNVASTTGCLSGLTSTLANASEFAAAFTIQAASATGVDTGQTGSAGFTNDVVQGDGSEQSHQVTTVTTAIQAAFTCNAGTTDTILATFRDAGGVVVPATLMGQSWC